MKKISIIVLAMLMVSSLAYAEIGAITYSGKSFYEQQVFADFYNNSGSAISSNYVVVLDTSTTTAASGSTLGAYINTTTTANNPLVLGVTDQTIADGATGRVCVRGPHKVYLVGTSGAIGLGATLATTTTAGAGALSSSTQKGGEFGVVLAVGPIDKGVGGFTSGDGVSNYWVWVGKR